MQKGTIGAPPLATLLISEADASAGIVMCTDPVTGKNTFYRQGLPEARQRQVG